MPGERRAFSAAVDGAFDPSSERDFVSRYIDALRENIRDAQSSQARACILLVLSVLVFFLLLRNATEQLSFAGITVKAGSLPVQLVPALIAFLLFSIFDTGHYVLTMRALLRDVLRTTHRQLVDNRLDTYFVPRSSVFPLSEVEEYYFTDDLPAHPSMRLRLVAGYVASVLVTMCACVLFVGYCFRELEQRFGTDDLLFWISLVLSLTYLARAAMSPATRESVAFLKRVAKARSMSQSLDERAPASTDAGVQRR